jgi:flagellar hook protein FlgE
MTPASVSGMLAAKTMFDVAAHDVANVNTAGFRPSRVDTAEAPARAGAVVDAVRRAEAAPPQGLSGTSVAEEFTELTVASAAFAANAAALRTQDEALGHLLDVLA